MTSKGTKMTRFRSHVLEVGYLFASAPSTIFVGRAPVGGRYEYPNAETVQKEGWKPERV